MNLVVVNASKADKHCIGPPGLCSACSWVMNLDLVNISKPHRAVLAVWCMQANIKNSELKLFNRVTDLAMVNAGKPDKH